MCRVPWQHVDTHTHTPWLGAHSHSETHTERTKERSFTAKLQTNWTLREEKFKDRAGAECRGGLAVFHKHTCAFQTDERLSHTGYTSQAKCILHLSHILSVAYADTPDRTASIVEEFGKAGTQMNRYLHNVPCVFLSVRTSSLMPLDLKIFHYGGVFVCASMNESEVRVSVFIPITDCGIPPPHWHLCTCSLPLLRERAKQKQQRKVRGCLLSQKDTTLSRRQSCGKPKKTTTIRAMWREGGGEVKRASVMGEQAGGHMET